jgi:hypothetical protein
MPADGVPALTTIGGAIFQDVGDALPFCLRAPKPVTEPLPSSQQTVPGWIAAIVFKVSIGAAVFGS